MSRTVQFGIDVLLDEHLALVRGRRVGLLTNPSGVDGQGRSALSRLWQHPDITLTALFGPEHGLYADVGDAVPVDDSTDAATRLPVYSLYGERLQPTPAMLDGLDVLVCDIQDVGVRFYTYIWTLSYMLETAGQVGVPVIVLDRPNPINGAQMEGGVLAPTYASFVGRYPILLRHGLTIGELSQLLNAEFNPAPAALTVVPCRGWRRAWWWDDAGLPWVTPSPALSRFEAVVVYPGMCFVEGTNLSEGRGAARPFEVVGAPWLDGEAFTTALRAKRLPGVQIEPCAFAPAETPTWSKWTGERCEGAAFTVTDRAVFRPVTLGVAALEVARAQGGDAFAWLPPDPDSGLYHIDRLAGSDVLRRQIDAGAPAEDIVAGWDADGRAFADRRAPYLLYD